MSRPVKLSDALVLDARPTGGIMERSIAGQVEFWARLGRSVETPLEGRQDELGFEKYVQRLVERLRDAIVPDESEGEAPLMPIMNRYKPIGATVEVDFNTTRPCHATMKSHIDQVVLDNSAWESSAGFRLESSDAVQFYARNDHMGLTIPYEYMGIDHAYEPNFSVRLVSGVTVVLEIKGFEDDQTKAKHIAAKRWVEAVNNWGELGQWAFHVRRNPQLLNKEMEYLARTETVASGMGRDRIARGDR